MTTALRLLVVEDSEDDARYLAHELRRGGFEPVVARVETEDAMKEALASAMWDIVFADYTLPHFDGVRALRVLQESGQDIPFIMWSGTIGEERAVEAVKAGANDYVMKDNPSRLIPAVERELREAEHRALARQSEAAVRLQSAALNAAGNAMVITGLDGAIEWVNPAFTAITGYTQDEAIGQDIGYLVSSGEHDRAESEALWSTLRRGDVWDGEMINRRKDGTLYRQHQTVTPVRDGEGPVTHFVAVQRDLTKERELEERLLQAQKMETVGQLAAGIAHDFNNILTIIGGTTALAAMKLSEADPLQEDLETIQNATDQAARLSRELLMFSRRDVVTVRVLDLGVLVTTLAEVLKSMLAEDIELAIDAPAGACEIKEDPGRMEMVVLNLAANARDAMARGGALTITVDAVELDEAYCAVHPAVEPGSYARLTVRDTGTGMDKAMLGRIFEPFYTTKRPGKGTGLGLSAVYGIVQQGGGSIDVWSEPGVGSTFELYLPRVVEAGRQPTPGAEAA